MINEVDSVHLEIMANSRQVAWLIQQRVDRAIRISKQAISHQQALLKGRNK